MSEGGHTATTITISTAAAAATADASSNSRRLVNRTAKTSNVVLT